MQYIVAHDVGTSGDKAVLLQENGELIGVDFEPYPTYYPRPLWAEQNPEDWWRAVILTTRRILENAKISASEVMGLAFSTQMVNAIPIDKEYRLLRPCISWLDGRAWAEAEMVMRKLGGPKVFASILGATLTGKDLLPKYLWLKKNEPNVYCQSLAIIDASSFLLLKATGRLVYEWAVASVTGLFNLKSKSWDDTIIRFFGLHKDKFPELVRSIDRVGGLSPVAAAELGLIQGLPVFGGAGDAMTAAVGSGAVGDGEGHLALGTSGFVGITTQQKVTGRRGMATLQSADPTKLLLVAETETAGECLKWAARELLNEQPGATVYQWMDQEVADTEAGSAGLLFTPWMYGERCPIGDESVRASFINLGANHTRRHLLRSIYEGVAFNFKWIFDSIEELYKFNPDPVRVIGGGAKGKPWLQIMADVTGRRMESVRNPQEASAFGAGLIALIGLGVYPDFASIKRTIQVNETIVPDATPQQTYQSMYEVYKQIYTALKPLYHSINRS